MGNVRVARSASAAIAAAALLAGCISFGPPEGPAVANPAHRIAAGVRTPAGPVLRYVVGERGPAACDVIYVHGTPGGSDAWSSFVADPVPGTRSIAIDRPGWGGSGPRATVWRLADQAAALEPLLGARPAILVGHSLGGPIVAKAAAMFPGRVAGIVIAAGSLDPSFERVTWLQRTAAAGYAPGLVPHFLRRTNEELLPLRGELERLRADLAAIACPVAIVHGTEDGLVPVSNVAFLESALPSGSIRHRNVIAGANHFLPWENSGAIRDAVEALMPREALPVEVEGIHNAHWLGGRVMSGAQPEGAIAFEELARLGIKTLICVDGAPPDAAEAAKHGIRAVHLPVGYDGIPRSRQIELVRAARDLPGPVFVHCHHGKHRGPAAAAVIAMGIEGWTPEQAVAAMKAAGTAADYAGLYGCVAAYDPPSAPELDAASAEFPARSPVGTTTEAMVHIDERWESLKLSKKHGWGAIPGHPDVSPPHEALMLKEHFRELHRDSSKAPQEYRDMMAASEQHAADLESAIRAADQARADAAFAAGDKACKACHTAYRNTVK